MKTEGGQFKLDKYYAM